jgi:hypothetical protein
MVNDISGASGTAADFSAEAVIDAAATLGDRLEDVKAIAMHSAIYTEALKNDLIEFIPQSQGLPIKTFRGMAAIMDDNLTLHPACTPRFFSATARLALPHPNHVPGSGRSFSVYPHRATVAASQCFTAV